MDYKDINDYEVIYMVREDDEDAIDILLNKYQPLLEKKISKWGFALKNREKYLEDIKQELNMCIIKAAKNYDENGNALLYTYINKTLDGYLMNYFKKYIKEENNISLNNIIEDEELDLCNIIPDNSNNPSENMDSYEIVELLENFSIDLPLDQSIMFEMHISGYKIDEIAGIVEKTPGNVRTTLSRIMKKLRKEMIKIQ